MVRIGLVGPIPDRTRLRNSLTIAGITAVLATADGHGVGPRHGPACRPRLRWLTGVADLRRHHRARHRHRDRDPDLPRDRVRLAEPVAASPSPADAHRTSGWAPPASSRRTPCSPRPSSTSSSGPGCAGWIGRLIEASEDLFATPWRTFLQVTLPQLLPADRRRRAAGVHVQLRRLHRRLLHERPGPDRADLPVRVHPSRRQPGGQRHRDRAARRHDPGHGARRSGPPAGPASGRVRPACRDSAPTRPRRDRAGPAQRPTAPGRRGARRPAPSGHHRAPTVRARSSPTKTPWLVRFAVSRATIREAVRGLVEEGYLSRRHGSGTYVTARPLLRNSLDRNFSYTSYLESTGVRAGRRITRHSYDPGICLRRRAAAPRTGTAHR